MRRGKQINVSVTDNLYERLCFYSEKLGQQPSLIAAIAIAEWVESREKSYRTVEGVKDVTREVLSGFMTDVVKLDERQLKKAQRELERIVK